ncbi:MAG: hypothetical protein J0M35_07355 [Candidatus Obscuribacter phosphatis]|uniref:B box-type domain-containing protein n=1 Tax=Candidatus Obscuribacter phosphatis TaxID=1906157 RepID=A0A8J7P773_9BACT|nr:hypothetical protein [Candidatus Obscuribacter phosphatis]
MTDEDKQSELQPGSTGCKNCGDSRLKCIDCSEVICPKCLVQCAVGNRCKKCAGRFTSHVLQVSPLTMGKAALFTAVVGFAFSFVQPMLPGFGFYGFLILMGLGYLSGRLLHKTVGYKLGSKIVMTVIAGFLLGYFLGPFHDTLSNALIMLQADIETQAAARAILQETIFGAALFLLGLVLPVLGK